MTSPRSLPQNRTAPYVALVFPPLLEESFRAYYPSTAVLAGYLSARGFSSLQTDLNEDFATNLLKPEYLEQMAKVSIGFGRTLPISHTCSAALLSPIGLTCHCLLWPRLAFTTNPRQ